MDGVYPRQTEKVIGRLFPDGVEDIDVSCSYRIGAGGWSSVYRDAFAEATGADPKNVIVVRDSDWGERSLVGQMLTKASRIFGGNKVLRVTVNSPSEISPLVKTPYGDIKLSRVDEAKSRREAVGADFVMSLVRGHGRDREYFEGLGFEFSPVD